VNALPAPEATVIASIGRDHADWLGSSLRDIYFEKRGVARPGVPMVQSAPRALWPDGDRQYRAAAVPAWTLDREIRVRTRRVDWKAGAQTIDVEMPGADYRGVRVPFLGGHQARNAALALALCHHLRRRGWPFREAAVREGFSRARWPGRFEVVPGRPPVILDGAHNVDAARVLAETLKASPWGRSPVTLVFGCLKDKDAAGMVRVLKPLVRRVILLPLPSERSRSPAELKPLWRGRETLVCGTAAEAFRRAAGWKDAVVATGSLYLVGEAIKVFRRKRT
jgi:dihydrofolate synthase / folylpolyglutamate synthase